MNKPIPKVEARKPFEVQTVEGGFAVVCKGSKPMFPNTHVFTELVTFFYDSEADRLADALNKAFADHFEV